MTDDLVIDHRLPPLVEIDDPIRQQMRRVGRSTVRCCKCHRPVTPDDVCFADGHDAHRFCAETWNAEILAAWEQLKHQDAKQEAERSALSMGLAIPKGSALWTPPTATKPAKTLAVAGTAA